MLPSQNPFTFFVSLFLYGIPNHIARGNSRPPQKHHRRTGIILAVALMRVFQEISDRSSLFIIFQFQIVCKRVTRKNSGEQSKQLFLLGQASTVGNRDHRTPSLIPLPFHERHSSKFPESRKSLSFVQR